MSLIENTDVNHMNATCINNFVVPSRLPCQVLVRRVAKLAQDLTNTDWESDISGLLDRIRDVQAVRDALDGYVDASHDSSDLVDQIGTTHAHLRKSVDELEYRLKSYIPSRQSGAAEIHRLAADILNAMRAQDAVNTFLILEGPGGQTPRND